MRTEFKIGITVGLFLAILAVTYFIVFGGDGSGAPREQGQQAAAERGEGEGFNQPEGLLGRTGQGTGRDVLAGKTPGDGTMDPTPESRDVGPSEAGFEPSVLGKGAGEEPVIPHQFTPLIAEELPVIAKVKPEETPGDVGPAIGLAGGAPAASSGGSERIYIVKEGDAGFWAIAENLYGEGRHWDLIARANPSADSNALRPGQGLRIPPKPQEAELRESSAIEGGSIIDGAGGRKLYVVKRGDAGFWGIAEAAYGKGKYWPLIARANPKVDSSAIRPGTKLVIPPLTEPREPKATADAGSGGSVITNAAGQKIYVVKDGDAGFWGVSQAAYGRGIYWPFIAQANPKVHSDTLRPGQKLVIPTLTEAQRRAPAPAAPRPPARMRRDTAPRPVVMKGGRVFD